MLLFFLLLAAGSLAILRVGPASAPAAGSRRAAAAPAAGVADAGLVLPVAGVRAEQLADTFGDERGDGARGHGAIDIMAPAGTPVLAATAGTVEKLFDSKLGGHTLYLRTRDGGTITYYAHLDRYAPGIAEGVTVAAGTPIAFVGSTGDASPEAPHLHFEVHRMAPGEGWWQGTGINPYPLLTH
ncbi:M23 family metallopeptidase [Sphingomonas quercus]